MNERIKNLVKQTARELVYEHDDEIGGVMDVWKFQNKDIEKFAELIVKECILTIQMGITRDGHNTEKYLRSMKHIKQIKEHFGVQ